ncbi:TraR/DksA C4-type zinc finger protein [Shewanella gelidii]|uniref:Molecular chaperone DnaK n=1 Tax=Shewanella gelidii TaxID=1642821 RepID=A0A917JP95_9GAMM|nr:TraR/DksA C4-type zinc finger protein [Shewanella gelidii]MCL1097877.1 TraR/DksA C4-type zinc finger protein [Shewanella gelidii]GGI78011.1 molecular chaperone DnaK [Shewanella gelidii]
MAEELTSAQKHTLLEGLKRLAAEGSDQLASLHEHSAPVTLDQQSVGRVSRIDAIQQQQMAQANEVHLLEQLKRIKKILAEPDEYGFCEACGEGIGFPRLEIHPTAAFCITCQAEKE